MTAGLDRTRITGDTQYAAWQRRALPPVERVRPDLWSVPVPIPDSPLRYTLSYSFVTVSGLVVVDPGWDSPAGRAALTRGLTTAGATIADVAGVVLTHTHPDHHGLSGWLRERAGAWVAMHPAEAATLPARAWRSPGGGPDTGWLRRNGVAQDEAEGLRMDPAQVADLMRMVEPDRLVHDGDRLPVAGRDVRAVWTPGHTPGHLCLHDADAGVLLTGDHLLPRISPNIGVHRATDGDPLSAYLASLHRTAAFRDEEALPAHEYRFRGIEPRAAELVAHHRERGGEIVRAVDALGQPTAWAVAERLTWSRGWPSLHGMMRRLALAETIAHLHHLATEGVLVAVEGDPIRWARRSG